MNTCDLIFGLMSALGRTEYGASQLKELLSPFGVTETGLRTALSRMSAKNTLRIRRSGKAALYTLTPRGERIRRNIALSFSSPDWTGWGGAWWGVIFSVPEEKRENRYRIRKKLAAYRFAPLYAGFWIRPLHPRENLDRRLADLAACPSVRMIRFEPISPFLSHLTAKIWRLKKINRLFSKGLRLLSESRKRIHKLSPAGALVERMTVGDEIVNMLSQDPLLPKRFLPDDWRGDALRREFLAWDKNMALASRPYCQKILKS